ncbi:MAG: CDP-archaeol synthase [Thermoplasmata archaeon]|nr:CDP-archaeol synthase [Thermoplasmata archaeon]MCI4359474.1 CDP-archaeol synthase [Thermoplasmata archaeon]
MVSDQLLIPARVLWVLTTPFLANAFATIPKGRGPPMDLGRLWTPDGRRILGASKTWSGLVFGTLAALPFGVLQSYLILIAPTDLAIVPPFAPTVVAAIPVILLLSGGALAGDVLGSFVKRRLGRPSGSRAFLLDQLPFVLLPVGVGLLVAPGLFVPVFWNPEGFAWMLLFTLGMHALFNYVGYWAGWKKVPW